jgi:uncharacterized cupin superfamily protein
MLPDLLQNTPELIVKRALKRGKAGAHQIVNGTGEPVRVLMLSTLLLPDVVEYLDSGKVSATSPADGRLFRARVGPELEYWDGE